MAKLRLTNARGGPRGVWVEPWGDDHWLNPGETFTVLAEDDPGTDSFNVVHHDQGVSIWYEAASWPEPCRGSLLAQFP